jgi:muramoyltetrapeptide carboxypeptidase
MTTHKENMNLIQPDFLKKGDTIGIVACARKISAEELQPAIDILKSWGLNVKTGKNVFNVNNQFSGTDEERAEDLQTMLNDSSIKAIISARGGYGTVRIIDKIDFTLFKKAPKWVVGYSDITVLHSHIHNLGIQTLHATMPINFMVDKEATESLRKALFGETIEYTTASHILNRKGTAEGMIVGGNLSLLYALSGSSSDIDTKGKILFIEDLDEYLYHIDRMMMNLKRSGKLSDLAGLIVGGMTDMKDNTVPFGKTAEEIILDAVKEYNYPVCFNFPAGHVDRNMALIFGKKATLTVAQNEGGNLKLFS